jgi:ribosomal 50S subunit-associated protein YjgA (DUF615 family)
MRLEESWFTTMISQHPHLNRKKLATLVHVCHSEKHKNRRIKVQASLRKSETLSPK